jgi:hypothetical protein
VVKKCKTVVKTLKTVVEKKFIMRNGQNHGFARAIEIPRFFRDLIFVDASEMNNTVGFVLYQLVSGFFSSLCVFNTRVGCNLFHQLFSNNFDPWIL